MKHVYSFLTAVLLLCLAGCKQGPDFGDAVYITGTLSSSNIRFSVDGQSSMGLTVTASAKAESDVKVTLQPAPELLDAYNASTARNCQFPPEGSYSLGGSEVIIEQGQTLSSAINLTVDSEKLQEGISYCIPVRIAGISGGDFRVLDAASTAYVLLTKVITIKAAYLNGDAAFDIPTFGGDDSPVKALGAMTLEMKVYPVSFPTSTGASGISSLCGCEENFLFRFGDGAGNPNNRLQLAKASIGTPSDPNAKEHYTFWVDKDFETGHWLHFAAVYDGKYLRVYLDGEQVHYIETKGGTINLSTAYDGHDWSDTFSIGRSVGYQRFFNGYISECRVWNVARSQAELQDGVCYVDPTSEGLIAYWRFDGQTQDDGTVLDMTGHGYNAQPYGKVSYVDGQKCPY